MHQRVVILGGGFGGMYAALHLEKELRRGADLDVVLLNRENFFLFTPMLHEVAASDLDVTHIVNPIRKLLRRVRFFHGEVERVDLANRRIVAQHGPDQHHHEIEFDHLVLGLGSVTSFHGLPGREHALTMKSLDDAVRLRHRLIESLEDADFECSAHRRRPLLTCVVAGGGFAGVETAAAVHDFLHEAVRFYPHVDPAQLRLVLVHSGPVLLPELGEKLGRYAQEKLAGRGIEVRVGTRVSALAADRVTLADGTTIETSTVVWTAGTSPHPLLATLPCRTERGRVVVDEFLSVPDHPGVWALGDCAQVPDLRAGGTCPPTAQHAVRQGKVLARNLVAAIDGRPRRAFSFATLGQLAAIGRRTGVARVFGVQFSGFAAWWLWRTVYLGKLPRFEKKLRVALDWTLDVLFSKDLVHLSSRPPHAVHAVPAAGDAAGLEVESCDLPARR